MSQIRIFISALQTWLDQTTMGPRSSIHRVPAYLFSEPVLFSSVAVGWFFTSMSLMEGKGTSGVADSLSTVRLLLPLSQPFF
jgi:hypothetical protein